MPEIMATLVSCCLTLRLINLSISSGVMSPVCFQDQPGVVHDVDEYRNLASSTTSILPIFCHFLGSKDYVGA